ncbi:hypothetical protein [Rhizobium giardinii]|uniref:hypothetical protein n=1 Tax=Rhizobium giardinii TaxID=56731 RepID=UPI003D6EB374
MKQTRFALLLLLIFAASSAVAQDSERITVEAYINAVEGGTPQSLIGKRSVVDYLKGVRDHLWWVCQRKTTLQELFNSGATLIDKAKKSKSEEAFALWAKSTYYGDVVFDAIDDTGTCNK